MDNKSISGDELTAFAIAFLRKKAVKGVSKKDLLGTLATATTVGDLRAILKTFSFTEVCQVANYCNSIISCWIKGVTEGSCSDKFYEKFLDLKSCGRRRALI